MNIAIVKNRLLETFYITQILESTINLERVKG